MSKSYIYIVLYIFICVIYYINTYISFSREETEIIDDFLMSNYPEKVKLGKTRIITLTKSIPDEGYHYYYFNNNKSKNILMNHY